MQGLLKEGDEVIHEIVKSPVLDTALIGAAQKAEHYEISVTCPRFLLPVSN